MCLVKKQRLFFRLHHKHSQFAKLGVVVGFVIEMLPFMKLVKDRDVGNLVEGVGASFSYIYFGDCFVFLCFLVKHPLEFI